MPQPTMTHLLDENGDFICGRLAGVATVYEKAVTCSSCKNIIQKLGDEQRRRPKKVK